MLANFFIAARSVALLPGQKVMAGNGNIHLEITST